MLLGAALFHSFFMVLTPSFLKAIAAGLSPPMVAPPPLCIFTLTFFSPHLLQTGRLAPRWLIPSASHLHHQRGHECLSLNIAISSPRGPLEPAAEVSLCAASRTNRPCCRSVRDGCSLLTGLCVFSLRCSKQGHAVLTASAVPPEEHHRRRRLGGGDRRGRGAAAPGAARVRQEETVAVSGSQPRLLPGAHRRLYQHRPRVSSGPGSRRRAGPPGLAVCRHWLAQFLDTLPLVPMRSRVWGFLVWAVLACEGHHRSGHTASYTEGPG